MTKEQKKKKEEELKQKAEQEFQNQIGFRKVIDLVAQSRKPLVGHNLFTDLVRGGILSAELQHVFCRRTLSISFFILFQAVTTSSSKKFARCFPSFWIPSILLPAIPF